MRKQSEKNSSMLEYSPLSRLYFNVDRSIVFEQTSRYPGTALTSNGWRKTWLKFSNLLLINCRTTPWQSSTSWIDIPPLVALALKLIFTVLYEWYAHTRTKYGTTPWYVLFCFFTGSWQWPVNYQAVVSSIVGWRWPVACFRHHSHGKFKINKG